MNPNVKTAHTRPVEVEFMEYEEPKDLFGIAHWIGSIISVDVEHYSTKIEYGRNGSIYDTRSITIQAGDFIVKDLDGFFRVYDRHGFRKYFELKEN